MASKVNFRFVAILGTALLAAFGAVAVIGYQSVKKSGEDFVKLAAKAEQEGQLAKAVELYGRAVNKDQRNVEWIKKWIGAQRKYLPTPRQVYIDYYNSEYILALRGLADADRASAESQTQFLEEIYQGVMTSPSRASWEGLATRVEELLRTYQGDEAGRGTIVRYRGLARAALAGLSADPKPEDLKGAEEDLELALKSDPKDTGAFLAWLGVRGAALARARAMNEQAEAEAILASLKARINEYAERNAPSPEALMSLLRLELAEAGRAAGASGQKVDGLELVKERSALLQRAVDALRAQPAEQVDWRVAGDIAAFAQFALPDGVGVGRSLFEHAASGGSGSGSRALPNKLLSWSRYELGAGNTAKAEELSQRVADLPDLPMSLEGMMLHGQRATALIMQAEAALTAWERSAVGEERTGALARAKAAREKLAGVIGEGEPQVKAIDARLAYAGGDLQTARALLTVLNQQGGQRDMQSLLLEARILAQQGNNGAAKSIFERVLTMDPRNTPALVALARLEAQERNYEAARRHFAMLAALHPDNAEYKRQQDLIEQVQLGSSSKDPVVRVLTEATRLTSGLDADPAKAIEVLKKGLAENANDPRLAQALALVLSQRNDREGALEVVRTGLAATPGHPALTQMEKSLQVSDPLKSAEEAINASQATPVQKQLALYEVKNRSGKREEALGHLREARTIAPEDPLVVEYAFQEALIAERTEEAQELARLGESKNMDRLGGRLFRARLLLSERKFEDAARLLREALEQDKLNQAAWRVLGAVEFERREYARSADAFREAVAIRPNDADAVLGLVQALRRTGKLDEALAVARRSETQISASPEFTQARLELETQAPSGDRERAMEVRQRIAQSQPDNVVNNLELANLLLQAGRVDEAKALIEQSRGKGEPMAVAQLESAAKAVGGDVDGAKAVWRAYIDGLKPEARTEAVYRAAAQVLLMTGNFYAGVAFMEEGRSAQGAEMNMDRELGDLMFQSNKLEEAVTAYRRVVDSKAPDEGGRVVKRMLEAMLRLGKHQEVDELLASLGERATSDATFLLLAAESARAQDDRERARQLLDRAVQANPNDPVAFVKRAEFNSENPLMARDVEQDLLQALKLDPKMTPVRAQLSRMYFRDQRVDEGVKQLRDGLTEDPYNDQLRLAAVEQLVIANREADAIDVMEGALKLYADDPSWAGRAAQFNGRLGRWQRAGELFGQAWEKVKNGDVASAYVDALLKQTPPDTAKALTVVNAPDLDAEKNPATRLLRARVYLAAKRTDQANTDVAAAYGLIDSADPTKAQAFTAALRGTFETIKEYEQALKRLESRKAFGPWLKLWTSAALLNDDSTREAGAAPIRALGERAEDSRVKIAAWRVLAASAYGRKQFEEAERYFREVLKLEPGDPEANNNLAYMLGTDLKRPADGLPFAEKALVSAPDSSPLLDTLGTLHMQLNQMDQARVMLAKALEKARSEAEQFPALVHMAQAELAVGNKDEALRYFMAAAQYQMTNPQAGSAYIEDLKALQAALKP